MDFESYAKLWPHQLDLLSGPLLEDDDDDVDNRISDGVVSSVQSTDNLSENSTNEDFLDSFEADDLSDVVHDKFHSPSKGAVHRVYVGSKNSFSPIKKTSLGMVVYVGRKHSTRADSDEEVDIETVEEELNAFPVRKSALSYHAFSRQVLSVLEDKEILHEVPNVIFASDTDKDTSVSHISYENTRNSETKCSTTVLQANDVDSLLEQFEASEGITSQELTKPSSSLLADNVVTTDDNAKYTIFAREKKDVSPYIIQKIKMSSATKKGPILIPPSHQPKSKSRNSSQNGGIEMRKCCRSSSSSSSVNKECASQSKNIKCPKYSFMLDHDHDYCTNSVSSSCVKVEDTKSMVLLNSPDKHISCANNDFASDESIVCYTVSNSSMKKLCEEEYFVPDAEVEVEILESVVDISKRTSVKVTSCVPNFHDKNISGADICKSSCNAKSGEHIDISQYSVPSAINSDKVELSVVSPMELLNQTTRNQCFQNKSSVTRPRLGTAGSVLINNRISEVEEMNSSLQHNSSYDGLLIGKRCQGNSFTSSPNVSPNKKHCTWPTSNSHDSRQMACDEQIVDDALCKRARSPCVDNNGRPFWKSEKQKQIEERRVVYVGKLTEGMKVNDLRECFVRFGPIQDISIHFRESGDNYGFVTFFNRSDAYEVVERGKRDPKLRKFDLCFGGRRQFCRTRYSDLDSADQGPFGRSLGETDFDTLLQKAKAGFQNVRHRTTVS